MPNWKDIRTEKYDKRVTEPSQVCPRYLLVKRQCDHEVARRSGKGQAGQVRFHAIGCGFEAQRHTSEHRRRRDTPSSN